MKRNMKVRLSLIVSIVGLLLLAVGTSYALFSDDVVSSNSQIIKTGGVKISLSDSAVSLSGIEMLSDAEGMAQTDYFDFSISNIGDSAAIIEVSLEDNSSSNTLSADYIKVGVSQNSGDQTVVNLGDSYRVIANSFINTSTTISYRVRVWLDEDKIVEDGISISNGSSISLKIVVNAEQSVKRSLYNLIEENADTTTTPNFQYINNYNTNGINTNDTGIFLYNGTDDNGGDENIYYYRGNVTDNNVLFGGYCWKIIRTTSTGGVKLIYNGVPSSGTCNNTGTASQLSSTSAFNSNYSSPADVGYMYGTRYAYSSKSMSSDSTTYVYGKTVSYSSGTYTLNTTTTSTGTNWSTDKTTLANGYHYTCFTTGTTCTTVYYITYFGDSSTAYYLTFTGGDTLETAKTKMFTNTNNSTIKTAVDTWYSTNLSSYSSYLENTIFCNDRSFASGSSGGTFSGESVNSTGYSYFAAYERIYFTFSPSLTCTNQNDRFSLSTSSGGTVNYGNNALTYPVGLITADEVNLAGGIYSLNSNYYLYTGDNYWLFSPCYWHSGSISITFSITSDGYLSNYYVGGDYGVRPVISLKSETMYLSGDGTVNSPYIIN